jgi:hypothetical protein
MLKVGMDDPDAAKEIWLMCSRDVLFWWNTYVWTYDPRKKKELPFITFNYQDVTLLEMEDAIDNYDDLGEVLGEEGYDLGIEKSRDRGVSWMGMGLYAHRFAFKFNETHMVMSRNADLVDKNKNPDCLFWKLEYIIQKHPGWLRPLYSRTEMLMANPETSSSIVGSTTTADSGRGGRSTSAWIDEFPAFKPSDSFAVLKSTQANTNCRFFVGTPKGTAGASYELKKKGKTKFLRLHWPEDPRHNKGLYIADEKTGKIKFLTKTPEGRPVEPFRYPEKYEFVCDNKIRSAWYDRECNRAANPQEIAQELDIDWFGASYQFFGEKVLERIISSQSMDPLRQGNLLIKKEEQRPLHFEDADDGAWRLWLTLTPENRVMPGKKYILACDISAGTGASNSVMSIIDRSTCEKVAEFASAHVLPETFAEYAIATAKWFNNAYLNWENNGPGSSFGVVVRRSNYENYHCEDGKAGGWNSRGQIRVDALSDYRKALKEGVFSNPSFEAINECREYINLPDGSVVHQAARHSEDPTGAKNNHGDRVMADVIALITYRELGGFNEEEQHEIVPMNDFGRRQMEYELEMQNAEEEPW